MADENHILALQYPSHADETERHARIMRIHQSLDEQSADSSSNLRKITLDIDKGKGHVFDYENQRRMVKKAGFEEVIRQGWSNDDDVNISGQDSTPTSCLGE
ncbi:unnamed protein product [Arabis nemorensis]|uniref:Uncharacterized protein n=1 Tax=Arabis nemorensis TaxID=586526 RepID=A0A565C0T5_9BRAS|nr:unnamed protein product [Arabis nemorensis]